MDRLSFFQYLMHRFGSVAGALLVVASMGLYFNSSTVEQDHQSALLFVDTKAAIEAADREGTRFLSSGKALEKTSERSADLDVYNSRILKIGENFKKLTENLQGAGELQTSFLEVQNEAKDYFLAMNDRIQKRQSKKWKPEADATTDVAASEKLKQVLIKLDKVSEELQKHSSSSWGVGSFQYPVALWELWAGLLLAAYCLWMHQRAAAAASEEQEKDLSDLKIQSIILDGILNSISEAMIVVDESGRFTRYNTAAQRMIGTQLKSISTEEDAKEFGFFKVDPEEASLGQDDVEALPLRLAELPFAKAMNGEQCEDVEFLVRNSLHPEGMYISASSRYLSGLNGHIHGALVVFRDISRRKATEHEWMRARESALQTAQKKSDFLAAMSHEIRTPMNGVMGMTTLLADTALSEEQKDYVGTIQRSAEALLRLINDILDHSKIEAGKIEFNLRPFDLKGMCEDVLELFQPFVQEKNVGLNLELVGRDAWNFIGDAGRVRQILVNLVGNAVKFTELGEVRLKVEGTAGSALKFSVIDTGAGFSNDESKFLFQKYSQTKSGMKYGGTGLGLSICQQLVELMGGEIGVHSQSGVGSTFWFTISLPETTADQIVSVIEPKFASMFRGRVLLAEDQVINQRVAVTYLQKLGLTVDVANNGQIAVEKALAGHYDLILMDCQMPVMTGYEATQRLREKQTGERTPIVALTAEGTSGEQKTCLSVGMDDFLTKPLELVKLTEVLQRWLKSAPQVLDLQALAKLKTFVVNNKSLTDALIEDFMKTAPALTADMFAGLEKKDLESISQAAHALKSCSATLGATGLAELCQQIEDAEELNQAESLLKTLNEHVETSSRELKKHWTSAAAA